MLSPAARITLEPDWRVTAEELAARATDFLLECGFDAKFGCSERLVRYYMSRGVLSPPEKDKVDRRKALFGPLQFRQLVLTRLLAERGWDLERVAGQLHGMKGARSETELDALLNQLAEPTQAERLLFKSRRDDPRVNEQDLDESSPGRPIRPERASFSANVRRAGEPTPRSWAREALARKLIQSAREEEGGLERLSLMAEKLLRDPDLSERESAALKEMAEMARLAFRQGGRKERWTRVKLAPWREVNLRVGKESELSESQKSHIIKEFTRLLEDYDSRLGL